MAEAQDNTEIYEYLANEVLARFPEDLQEFLVKTAVLAVVTPEESDLLLRRRDSAEILSRLEKESLFLTRLAGAKRSYRYHQLFREFLLERLGSERRPLQLAAGHMARERRDLAMAVEHFADAGADEELIAVLREAGQQAFRQGRWQTVERWLASLTRAQIAADPWFALFQARIEACRVRMEVAAYWVDAAAALFAARDDRAGLAESRVLQARILRYKGLYQQSLALLEEADPCLHQGEGQLRFDLPMEKSLSLVMTGRFKEAEALLQNVLAEAERAGDDLIAAYMLEGLGHTYYLQGKYGKALRMYRKRLEIAPERDFPYYYVQDFTAAIYQEWGELDQAFEYARRNVAFKENLELTDTLPSAYFQLADIYLNRRDLKNAEEYFRRAVDLIEKTSGERFYLSLSQAYLARCLREQGRLAEALAMMEATLAEAQNSSRLALAICQELGASIYWSCGKKREAKEMLTAAILSLEEMGFPRPLGHAYAAMVLLCAAEGRHTPARPWHCPPGRTAAPGRAGATRRRRHPLADRHAARRDWG
ncbi:MAG: tetratricopeptide repeat protein [Bacteroidota bacterium]